jgi:hypothetical protein
VDGPDRPYAKPLEDPQGAQAQELAHDEVRRRAHGAAANGKTSFGDGLNELGLPPEVLSIP